MDYLYTEMCYKLFFNFQNVKASIVTTHTSKYQMQRVTAKQTQNEIPLQVSTVLTKLSLFSFTFCESTAGLQKLLCLQPVLRGAIAKAKKLASWAGSAPSTGHTARTWSLSGHSLVYYHFSKEDGGGRRDGYMERKRRGKRGKSGELMERMPDRE